MNILPVQAISQIYFALVCAAPATVVATIGADLIDGPISDPSNESFDNGLTDRTVFIIWILCKSIQNLDPPPAIQQRHGHPILHMMVAASYGLAGKIEYAKRAIVQLTILVPNFAAAGVEENVLFCQREDRHRLAMGLRSAGLPEWDCEGRRRLGQRSYGSSWELFGIMYPLAIKWPLNAATRQDNKGGTRTASRIPPLRFVGQVETLNNGYIGCRRPFGTLNDLKSDPVAFVERPETLSIDTGVMDKHIRPIFLFNKAVAFAAVEPLHYAVNHAGTLLSKKFSCFIHKGCHWTNMTNTFITKPARQTETDLRLTWIIARLGWKSRKLFTFGDKFIPFGIIDITIG
jgi:hypothetical protein